VPKVSEQYKDDQRAQILAAARRCFVRNGFHRTSMQDVFTESGRSAGAVYRYFPRKEDMIVAVATRNLDALAASLRAVLARGEHQRVGDVLAEILNEARQRQIDEDLATVALMVWSEALRNPVLAQRLRDAIALMSEDLTELIREQQHAGALVGAPPEALARAILAVLPGFLLEMTLLGPETVADVSDAVRVLLPG
jgi:AcrR family transcriptional regulator